MVLPQVGGGGRSRSRVSLDSVMESRGLHILGRGYRSPNAESGATTSSQHPQPLLRFGQRGGLGRGCLLGTEDANTPAPSGAAPRPSRSPPPPPPSCVWVSPFRASTPLSGLGPAESACLSESLTPSHSLSMPGSGLAFCFSPGSLPAFLFRHLCVSPGLLSL